MGREEVLFQAVRELGSALVEEHFDESLHFCVSARTLIFEFAFPLEADLPALVGQHCCCQVFQLFEFSSMSTG